MEIVVITLALLASLVVAGLVVAYVAFPHRGNRMPRTPWLGTALEKAVAKAPTLDNR